ncbi:hypothetical protein AVEN_106939-1 [Araneus ventricosus]|uniref:Uncharacterized protein n=1 Tax=Araneus ventricosus TaxID=182803 RepID=A0A4Y2GIA9_ARAVE|nr:hypothetical protein AVEN_106939-1 [Araneus ventricosus]
MLGGQIWTAGGVRGNKEKLKGMRNRVTKAREKEEQVRTRKKRIKGCENNELTGYGKKKMRRDSEMKSNSRRHAEQKDSNCSRGPDGIGVCGNKK